MHHFPGLEKTLGNDKNHKTTFGKIIDYDANSRNLLDEGDAIIVEKQVLGPPYYCPFRGCNKISNRERKHIYKHIKERHDQGFSFSRKGGYVFKNRHGQTVDFTENSKDLVADGDKIVHVRNLKNKKVLYYCPYQGCDYSPRFSTSVYRHIREKHYPAFPKFTVPGKKVFKTTTNQIIDFTENTRNLLKSGDPLLVENIIASAKRYYCPYRACSFVSRCKRSMVIKHIRMRHFPELQHMYMGGRVTMKTTSGKIIDFAESSKSLLSDGEVILVHVKQEGRFYCPYQDCTCTTISSKSHMYPHIRKRHFPELPSLASLLNPLILKRYSDKSLILD
ncbi:hypothetical protein BDA99DRAFT_227427 [Phascolomyces articulosus]|uniref:C2H2-type domain-containing protein n=1 Tax=Phascolomyces articulosus TaxID=60185 RepID=A0AAD5JQD6_9FUNG|nr:hypothetical protein BDA99DRAFT_227427 [Phascolomyces articulosus]